MVWYGMVWYGMWRKRGHGEPWGEQVRAEHGKRKPWRKYIGKVDGPLVPIHPSLVVQIQNCKINLKKERIETGRIMPNTH